MCLKLHEYVELEVLMFPEFSPNRYVRKIKALIFDDPNVRYDMLIGRKTMKFMELKLDFQTETMEWIDKQIPFHPTHWYSDKEAIRQVLALPPLAVTKAELRDRYMDAYYTEIKAAHYERANLEEVVAKQSHLTEEERADLLAVFMKHEELFNGKVGKFPREFHLDVDPNVPPYNQQRPYPLNRQHLEVLKDELDRQEALGIIKKCNEATLWCLPMFIRPKKDGTIRTVHDFRMLNKAIRQKIHILPRIDDIMLNMG